MRARKSPNAMANGQEGVGRLIEQALGFTSRALEICDRLPEVHIDSPTMINLGTLGPDSVAVKREIKRELEILKTTLERLQLRSCLPLVIGVIGRFNGGKSSLLNSFFRVLFPDALPSEVARKTENTATDTKLTYITHTEFASQVKHTPEIEIVAFDHQILQAINFIDTPGTGWKSLDRKEVVDLLSAADILLFISKPLDLLDHLSVEVLNQKFSAFNQTPMWYVVTFASMYCDLGTKGDKPDEGKFHRDLIDAKTKLRDRPCSSPDELSARDRVATRVEFEPGVNTFLVDSISGFGTHELLDRVLSTFDSTDARMAKRRSLAIEVDNAYGSLLKILSRSADHVSAIGRTLHLAYRKSIHPEIEKFIAMGLAAEVTDITQNLYSCVGEARSSTDQYFRSEPTSPTVSYSTDSAEVTILRSDLENMKDRKRSYAYAYRPSNMLFDVTLIRTRMDWLKLNAVDSVSRRLEELWSNRSTKELPFLAASLNKLIHDIVEYEARTLEKTVTERAETNRGVLEDYLRVPTQRLRNRYSSPDIGRTIFGRQYGLLKAMEQDIPLACKELRTRLHSACETAQSARASLTSKFTTVIESRVSTFARNASGLLHDSVYVPTQEALLVVLGENELTTAQLPGKKESEQDLIDVGSRLTELVRHDDNDLDRSLEQVIKDTESKLLEEKNHWSQEWNELKGQFDVLADNARDVAGTLDEKIREVKGLLEGARVDGLQEVKINIREVASGVSNVVRQKADQINLAVAGARSKAAAKYWLEVIALALTLVGSGLGVWKSWPSGKTSITPFILIVLMGVAIASWIVKQLRTKREQEEKSVYLEFKKSVDELRQNVNAAASAKISEMCDDIENRNANLAEALDRTYEAVIDSCESANDRIIPSLMTQIEKGAHVALSTQKSVAMTAAAGIARSVQYLSTEVEKTARQVSEQMRNQSGLIIRNSGERCAEAIRTQVQKHRNLAEDFQQLITAVQKGNAQAHTAGQ